MSRLGTRRAIRYREYAPSSYRRRQRPRRPWEFLLFLALALLPVAFHPRAGSELLTAPTASSALVARTPATSNGAASSDDAFASQAPDPRPASLEAPASGPPASLEAPASGPPASLEASASGPPASLEPPASEAPASLEPPGDQTVSMNPAALEEEKPSMHSGFRRR